MRNVTRYEFEVHEGGGEVVISETGGFVDYDDYLSQLQQADALQTSLNNIINAFGISGEGAHSKLVIDYVLGLVAENAALKECCEAYDADGLAQYGEQWEVTPTEVTNTDAAIAEIGAKQILALMDEIEDEASEYPSGEGEHGGLLAAITICANRVASLRAGRK